MSEVRRTIIEHDLIINHRVFLRTAGSDVEVPAECMDWVDAPQPVPIAASPAKEKVVDTNVLKQIALIVWAVLGIVGWLCTGLARIGEACRPRHQ